MTKTLQKSLYYLVHMSTQRNIDSICKTKNFILSEHNPNEGKIQWLGNGVYFWDINDYNGKELGKNLGKGKFRTNKIYGIVVEIEISKDNYLNLEEQEWSEKFTDFLKRFQPEYYNKIINYFEIIKQKRKPNTHLLNGLGELTGTTLNLFINILQNEYNYKIDMVSCYFYHARRNNSLFQREEKIVQQFCVRNQKKLNDSIASCKIIHII